MPAENADLNTQWVWGEVTSVDHAGKKLALEYLAVIVLGLLLLVAMLIFSTKVREKVVDAIKSFVSIIGRK